MMTDILKEARGDPIQVLKLTLEIMAGNVSGTSMTDNGQNNVDLSSAWELQSISTPQVSGTTVSASLISANGNTYSTREADEYQQVYQVRISAAIQTQNKSSLSRNAISNIPEPCHWARRT